MRTIACLQGMQCQLGPLAHQHNWQEALITAFPRDDSRDFQRKPSKFHCASPQAHLTRKGWSQPVIGPKVTSPVNGRAGGHGCAMVGSLWLCTWAAHMCTWQVRATRMPAAHKLARVLLHAPAFSARTRLEVVVLVAEQVAAAQVWSHQLGHIHPLLGLPGVGMGLSRWCKAVAALHAPAARSGAAPLLSSLLPPLPAARPTHSVHSMCTRAHRTGVQLTIFSFSSPM